MTTTLSLRAVGKDTAPLVIAGVLGQVAALARTLFVASQIGTGPALDALLVALVPPLVITGVLVSSLRTAIVPAYLEITHEQDEAVARQFVGSIVTWVSVLSAAATALLIIAPAAAVAVSGPGLDAPSRAAAIRFLPLVAPILVFGAVSTLLGALCQIAGRFLPITLGLAISPIVSLVVTLGLWERLGIDALAIGLTAGSATTLALTLAYVAWAGLLPRIAVRANSREVRKFLGHAVPLMAGSAFLQLNLLADRAVATLLAPGAVSALYYGQQLIVQPLASVSSAWMLVVYPSLVRIAQGGATGSLGSGATKAIGATLAVFVPISVAAAALAPMIVDVVYRRGAFGTDSALATAGVAAAFAPMVLGLMVQPILTGAHNARRRGTLLGVVALANAALNVALNVAFGLAFGVVGIALSTSITLGVLLFYLGYRLHADEPGFSIRSVASVGSKALLASAIPGATLALVAWIGLPLGALSVGLPLLGLLLLVGGASYLVTAHVIGLDQPVQIFRTLASPFWDRARRSR